MGVRAASLTLGALVIGTVVAVDPGGLAPFGPARWLAISTLGALGGGMALWCGHRRLDRRTLWLWTVLLGFLTLGALLGGDVPTALLGEPTRHLGLITWVLFLLLFAAGQQLDRLDVRVLARAGVLAVAAIDVWSLWERAVGRPIDIAAGTVRLTGPFGSAAMLGAACCLLVPICVAVATDRTERRAWRFASGISGVIGIWVLVESGSRAAWVGGGAAVIVAIVRLRPPPRALLAGATLGLAVIAVAAPRLGGVAERADGAASRLDEWRVASRVLGQHPLIGVGPEGYRIAVSEGIDRQYEREHHRDTVLPDRAHSGPLDAALDGGIVAALVEVMLVGLVCARATRLIERHVPTPVTGIGTGLIAYAVQQLLLFPLAELDPVWWLLAGAAVAIAGEQRSTASRSRRRWAGAAALACAPVVLVAGVLDVSADRLAQRALTTSDRGDAIDSAERAVSLRPDDMRYRMVVAETLERRGTLADIDDAIRQADHALDWSPRDPIAGDRWASLLFERAVITGDAADVSRSVLAWQDLVDRDPVRARWQVQLGRAAALAGDAGRARRAWVAAAELGSAAAADLLAELDSR